MPDDSKNVVAKAEAVTTGDKGTKKVSLKIPLPCITILIHGVNDVGEAYESQEIGICKGLNARLNRSHNLDPNGLADLVPSSYSAPPTDNKGHTDIAHVEPDPDAAYFHRTPGDNTWSPIVPFYWGYREQEDKINKHEYHQQWVDRWGNRLDKDGAKNGGPFANATSTLNDMWGRGFSGKVAGTQTAAKFASSPTHNLVEARPRHYMLLGAKRLAMLIKMIRTKYPGTGINVLCHSQGSMVTLAAHALLAMGDGVAADTVIVQDPPYSLEEAEMEGFEVGTDHQQTTQSRIDTLVNIVQYINSKKAAAPPLSDLVFPTGACGDEGVTGPNWKPGAGAQQVVEKKTYTFNERDNRGKFYLYFCPHDNTVSLLNIQGIGWQGVPDQINAQAVSAPAGTQVALPAFSRLQAVGFHQRMFTSEGVHGKPPLMVGDTPGSYEAPHVTGGVFSANKSIGWTAATSDMRTINGEELNPKIAAVLNYHEGTGDNAGKLPVDSIDAAIAVSGPGGIKTTGQLLPVKYSSAKNVNMDELQKSLPSQNNAPDAAPDDRLQIVSVENAPETMDADSPGDMKWVTYTTETPNEARRRWQKRFDDNSDHSSVPANPAHAEGVTAYDLSLGKPIPVSEDDSDYLLYLCAVADWRTNWKTIKKPLTDVNKRIQKQAAAEATPGATDLTEATFVYHSSGVLPPDIAVNDEVKLPIPNLIAKHSLAERAGTLSYPAR